MVYFGMHQNYSVDVKGAGEVKIKSTGYEKQHVMVMLYIIADGHKLPPCVILSHNMIPKSDMFPKRLYCICIKNGCMTADLMEDGVKNVWEMCPGAGHSPPSMLVLDTFCGLFI
jgi:hypothetical protein